MATNSSTEQRGSVTLHFLFLISFSSSFFFSPSMHFMVNTHTRARTYLFFSFSSLGLGLFHHAKTFLNQNSHKNTHTYVYTHVSLFVALLELTAISASFGAKDQEYHYDIYPTESSILYARSFNNMYSLFIQLQDTTSDMGATLICPGSQYCTMDDAKELCHKYGYPAVTATKDHNDNTTTTTASSSSSSSYWKAGDAILMNMHSFHRGGAHTNPQALDRVMLILTLGPKPRPGPESRQISRGATMNLRYDLYVRRSRCFFF